MCKHPLDDQARGSMCSTCWMLYVRACFPSQDEIQLVRKSIRIVEGSGIWYVPEDAALEASHEEVTQLTMF